jgi:hypothetical protein
MRIFTIVFILCLMTFSTFSQAPSPSRDNAYKIPFDENSNYSSTYHETVAFYKKLNKDFSQFKVLTYGSTDSGYPLYLGVLSTDGDFDPVSIREKGKHILMINNAIHPGESCGVEASMLLLRDYLQEKSLQKYLDNLVIIVIPMYNIGGALNRSRTSRTNQNGPELHGFRGNAQNLDLNRDFIKSDSRNAQTFNQIFTAWQPDVLIDNHTSNGADYQYTMTLVPTQEDKIDPSIGNYMRDHLLPMLFEDMKKRNWEMTPYVMARNTPDDGIASYLDLPRFSSGYAALFNTISCMPETHMLKPFKDRVASTKAFSESMIKAIYEDGDRIKAVRKKAIENTLTKTTFELNWEMDRSKQDKLMFKGYEAKYKPSEISGLDRLYYDRNEPWEKEIPWFRYYKPTLSVEKPEAYIIPEAYGEVLGRLKRNGVQMERMADDQVVEVEMYRIVDFKTRDAYEGHYLHYNVEVEKELKKWTFQKGDYVVYTDQPANRYIVETLEPQAPDSWFAWNFFDGILGQKEYFSSYVFEDLAAEYLKKNPELRERLEQKKKEDEKFAASAYRQLDFIYKNSPWHEPTYKLYPVGRVLNAKVLNLN